MLWPYQCDSTSVSLPEAPTYLVLFSDVMTWLYNSKLAYYVSVAEFLVQSIQCVLVYLLMVKCLSEHVVCMSYVCICIRVVMRVLCTCTCTYIRTWWLWKEIFKNFTCFELLICHVCVCLGHSYLYNRSIEPTKINNRVAWSCDWSCDLTCPPSLL